MSWKAWLSIPHKHQPTVGMLLVETVVSYALAGTAQPVTVSRYDLTASARAALPEEEELTVSRMKSAAE